MQSIEREADEWLTALGRIGRTPIRRLEWLLRFTEPERLSELTGRQLADLEAEVYAFIGSKAPGASGGRPPKLEHEALMRVVHQARQGIRHFVEGRPWVFPVSDVRAYVARVPKGRIIRGYYPTEKNWELAFLMSARDLIAEQGSRIRHCARKGCPHFFVRHKGGLYCSRACSQKERTERMKRALERSGESWTERRHTYYVRKMERLYGESVVVQRRKGDKR